MSSRNGKPRVLIAAKERGLRDQLRQLVLADGSYEIAGTAVDGQEAVQLSVLLRPEVILIKSDLPIFNGFEAAEMIGLAAPEVRSVLVGDGQPDAQILRKAMRSGLRAYLTSPVSEPELREALENLKNIGDRRFTPEYETATDPSQLPKVIVVTGGKGGIGKSTIATSLAMCLAQRFPGKVVLFDMYTQFGDIATMLNITSPKPLCELVQAMDEMDLEMLEGYMVEHETGLKVLVSTTNAQPIDAISVSSAESTLHNLKRAYTYIVVDMPPILHATTLYMLSHCYSLVLVTNLFDMPTVRDAKELYSIVLGDYVPEEKIFLVANRISKYDRLTLSDVERLFGRPVSAQVPNDRRLVSAVNQGVPFVKAYSRSPLVTAVDKIAQDIIHQEAVGVN
ncbi:MAG: AAA family ATPase [Armatimonadetes bacterium]|nr:AAA family ATPase [Armatimonadota bacterium]